MQSSENEREKQKMVFLSQGLVDALSPNQSDFCQSYGPQIAGKGIQEEAKVGQEHYQRRLRSAILEWQAQLAFKSLYLNNLHQRMQ